MGLFNRTKPIDLATRCPGCGERLPDGAHTCAMCGHDVDDRAEDRIIRLESSRNPS